MEATSACAEAAAAKHEGNKCACVDGGLPALLIKSARQPALGADALVGICAALRSFATADDARPTTSRPVPALACVLDDPIVAFIHISVHAWSGRA